MFKKAIICIVVSIFLMNAILPQALAQTMHLPQPGQKISLTPATKPLVLQGLVINPKTPFSMQFLINPGESQLNEQALLDKTTQMVQYFLAALTTPQKNLWVNLSPYEKNRIIEEGFGQTSMGRDLLAQDYVLKQLSSSLLDPQTPTGQKFWQKVYQQSSGKLGKTDIAVTTMNKIWIVPNEATVFVPKHSNPKAPVHAIITKSSLKVLMEEDYVANAHSVANQNGVTTKDSNISNQLIKEIVLPAITKEVNEGENFVYLRQIYNALILANWYKNNLKKSILNQIYSDKQKSNGIDFQDNMDAVTIYNQYLQAFKRGVVNTVREEQDPITHQMLPRKYFTGGADLSMIVEDSPTATKNLPERLISIHYRFSSSKVSAPRDYSLAVTPQMFGVSNEVAERWREAMPAEAEQQFLKDQSQRSQGYLYIRSAFSKPNVEALNGKSAGYVDIGGSTFRVGSGTVEVSEQNGATIVNVNTGSAPKVNASLDQEKREQWGGLQKIDYFVDQIALQVKEGKFLDKKMVVIFSFDHKDGVVLPGANGSKGWNWQDIVGQNLYNLFNTRLAAKERELKILMPRVTAVVNDSESTAALGDGGFINGTGSNEFVWDKDGVGYIFESGKQPALFASDRNVKGSQEFDGRIEAIMSAKHLGRLLFNFIRDNGLFEQVLGDGSVAESSLLKGDYVEGQSLESVHVTTLASKESVEDAIVYLNSLGIVSENRKDYQEVWQEAKRIVYRSAWLCAAQIWGRSQLFKMTDGKPLDIVVDGSMWKVPGYFQMVQDTIDSFEPNFIKLRFVDGATQKGGVILALSSDAALGVKATADQPVIDRLVALMQEQANERWKLSNDYYMKVVANEPIKNMVTKFLKGEIFFEDIMRINYIRGPGQTHDGYFFTDSYMALLFLAAKYNLTDDAYKAIEGQITLTREQLGNNAISSAKLKQIYSHFLVISAIQRVLPSDQIEVLENESPIAQQMLGDLTDFQEYCKKYTTGFLKVMTGGSADEEFRELSELRTKLERPVVDSALSVKSSSNVKGEIERNGGIDLALMAVKVEGQDDFGFVQYDVDEVRRLSRSLMGLRPIPVGKPETFDTSVLVNMAGYQKT